MFEDLKGALSSFGSGHWPEVIGEITRVTIGNDPRSEGASAKLVVTYKFSVGDDGPYTGESHWPPDMTFEDQGVIDLSHTPLRAGQPVNIRYNPKNPSISRLDKSAWGAV